MESLRVDPAVPIENLIGFRRRQKDQLCELSGLFDELKMQIENTNGPDDLEREAKRLYENKIRPSLGRLKDELSRQNIQSVWEGVQRALTITVPAGGVLAATTGWSGSILLGAGALIAIADVGVKAYLAASRARTLSPYSYLLDIQEKFSLPSYVR